MNVVGYFAAPAALAVGDAIWHLPGGRLALRFANTMVAIMMVAIMMVLGLPGAALAKCLPIAGLERGFIKAALPAAGSVRLTYLGHSSFLIETPEGVTVVTDYNGYVRPQTPPQVVTMNNAHATHYTDFIEPGIEFALRGWDPAGGIAYHDRSFMDLRVWNVPTNVRHFGGVRANGNSIFVFQVADLCIAHLGHLHHPLGDAHMEELGLIDVLLVPVDGVYTLSQDVMLEVIQQIGPSVVIPMHYFGSSSLGRFLALVESHYGVVASTTSSITLSRLTLPHRKVVVLPAEGPVRLDFDE